MANSCSPTLQPRIIRSVFTVSVRPSKDQKSKTEAKETKDTGMKTKTLSLELIIIALAALVFASVRSAMAQGGTWTTEASSPTPRRQVAVAAANGVLYTAGGAQAGSTSSIHP